MGLIYVSADTMSGPLRSFGTYIWINISKNQPAVRRLICTSARVQCASNNRTYFTYDCEIAISANFGVSLSVHRYSARLYCTGEEEDENIIAVIWSLNKCYNLKFGQEYHIFVGHCCKRPDVNAALFPISYRYQSIYPTHMHSPNINRTRNIRLALTRLRPHVVHTIV